MDTWTYDGTDWTPASPTTVPPATGPMAYDHAAQAVVMAEGSTLWSWSFSGGEWSSEAAPTAGARGKRKRTRDGKVIGRKVKVKRRDQKNAPSVHTGVMSHFYARAAMVGQRRYVALRRIPATQEGTGEEDYFALLEAPDTDEDEIAEGTGGFLQNFLSRVFSPAGRRAAQREGGGSLGQPIVLEEETAGAAASAPAPAQGRSTSWGTAGTTAEDFILIDDDEDEEEAPIAGQSRVDDTGAIVIVDDEVDKNAADASPGDGGAAAADVITIS